MADEAIRKLQAINAFLQEPRGEGTPFDLMLGRLRSLQRESGPSTQPVAA